jgi:hypothetical protein
MDIIMKKRKNKGRQRSPKAKPPPDSIVNQLNSTLLARISAFSALKKIWKRYEPWIKTVQKVTQIVASVRMCHIMLTWLIAKVM